MLLGGISIMGSYHGKNQDNYRYEKLDKGFVLAVSDGLGSKTYSEIGSKAICDSVCEVAHEENDKLDIINSEDLVKEIYSRWVEKMLTHKITDCYATMLLCVYYAGRMIVSRLGDGFIGVVFKSYTKVFFDRKEECFANETECLHENLDLSAIEITELDNDELNGVVVCTDGISIGNMEECEIADFVECFTNGYCDMNLIELNQDIEGWLSTWPGADDKTLAYFVAEKE